MVFSASSCSPAKAPRRNAPRGKGIIRASFANDVPYVYVDADGRLAGETRQVTWKILANLAINESDTPQALMEEVAP
jgi:hypothetical protein